MLKIIVNKIEYEYEEEISVGTFQRIAPLITDFGETMQQDNITAGVFAGLMADKGKLTELVAIVLGIDSKEVEKFPINKAIEIVNNFFYSNGFWFMISNHFSMPSEVKDLLTTPTTPSQNLKEKSPTIGSE